MALFATMVSVLQAVRQTVVIPKDLLAENKILPI